MRNPHPIRHVLEALPAVAGLLILPWLPRRLILLLASAAGFVGYRLARGARRVALANLEIAFGAALSAREREQLARATFRNFALVILDIFWFSRHARSRIARYVTFDPSIATAFAEQPAIGITAHFGNWELMGEALRAHGVDHVSVAAPLANPYVERLFARRRQAGRVQTIPRQGALRGLLRALRKGRVVGLLLDQNTKPGEGGVFVELFGLPTPISGAAAVLARHTGCPVVMALCLVQPGGRYRFYALPPFYPVPSAANPPSSRPPRLQRCARRFAQHCGQVGESGLWRTGGALARGDVEPGGGDDAPRTITQAIARRFEEEIRKYPEQWLWMYKRWKHVAPGIPRERYPFYAKRDEGKEKIKGDD